MGEPKKQRADKQEIFILEYLRDFNATRAAKRSGYSEKTAYSIGQELLKKPEIKAKVQAVIDERKQNLNISQERVLRELEAIAFARITDYLEVKQGRLSVKDTDSLEFGADCAIESITEIPSEFGPTLNLKLHSKTQALNALAKHLKLFDETQDADTSKTDRGAYFARIQDALSKLKGR